MHQPIHEVRKQDATKALRLALGDTFAFYFIAHAAHWNVTGPTFPSWHKLFGKYTRMHTTRWTHCRAHRTLDQMAPYSLDELLEGASVHAGLDKGATRRP